LDKEVDLDQYVIDLPDFF